MNINLGCTIPNKEPFELNIANIVTGRTFIASISRYGKSWTSRKIIEECFGHAGIIIIDPEGEYSSLRENPKYSFLIIGKDVPLQLETAEFMATKVLETKLSVIIDLSAVDDEFGKEYVDTFLKRFFFMETTIRAPYLVVVEEGEDYAPEKGLATTTCLGIFRSIAKKGGKRGIGLLIIAHRPAWVNKGVLSQCLNKAIGRMDWPADLDVIKEYLRIPQKTIDKLPELDKGEFFFAGDWVIEPTFAKVGDVITTHLGRTPDVIPPSPKELESVLLSLQKSLPEVIEKVKPAIVPIEQIKAQVKMDLEKKWQDRINGIQRTADAKAERKYLSKMEDLKEANERLSRSQALQSATPITDVFDHPIVRTRMSELSDKAKDLLRKIDHEPNLNRQQLAAFLTTSTDVVATLVEKINDTFKAKVVVGEGKPMQYKSQLVYFFGGGNRKEVQELEKLQRVCEDRKKTIDEKDLILNGLKLENKQLKENVSVSKTFVEQNGKLLVKVQGLEADKEKLIDENKKLVLASKAGEALYIMVNSIVDGRIKQNNTPLSKSDSVTQVPQLDLTKITELIEQIVAKKIPSQSATIVADNGVSTSVSLEHKVTHFDFQKPEVHVQANTLDLQGRIIYLITKGFFDNRHNPPEVTTELTNNGWVHDKKEVAEMLLSLCQFGIFQRKFSTGNYWWYSLTSEAKEHIHN